MNHLNRYLILSVLAVLLWLGARQCTSTDKTTTQTADVAIQDQPPVAEPQEASDPHVTRNKPEQKKSIAESKTLSVTPAIDQENQIPSRAIHPTPAPPILSAVFLSKNRTMTEVLDFLRSNEITNYQSILEESKPISVPDSDIQGCFQGEIVLKNATSTVTMIHEFSDLGQSNRGTYWIGIRDVHTKILSSNSGVDYSRRLRQSTLLKDQILIEMWPDAGMQLFYWKLHDRYIGNYYKKSNDGYRLEGTVQLDRTTKCHEQTN